jgi:hypothetical protein
MPTASDKGVTLFNRLVESLVREESGDSKGKTVGATP